MKFITITIFTITMAVAAVHAAATGAELHRERRIMMRKRQAANINGATGMVKTQDQINREQVENVITEFNKLLMSQEAAKTQPVAVAAATAPVPAPVPAFAQPQAVPYVDPVAAANAAPLVIPPAIQALMDNGCGATPGSTACSGVTTPSSGVIDPAAGAPVISPFAPVAPVAAVAPVTPVAAPAKAPAKKEEEKEGSEEEKEGNEEEKEGNEEEKEGNEEEKEGGEEEKEGGEEEKESEEKDEPEDEGNKKVGKRADIPETNQADAKTEEAGSSDEA
ncbi:hypothetical protein MFLAVUS_000980 [Mucor flavus]|uniref:Uncharacterized protein n=1 Tax=Mucor flavus TaxID=439312 RepID=A0ABP9YL69_9FUNG